MTLGFRTGVIICSLGTGLIDILGSDDHIFARRLHGWKGFHAMRYLLHLPSSLICLAEFSLFVILTVFSTQQLFRIVPTLLIVGLVPIPVFLPLRLNDFSSVLPSEP